MAIIKCPGCNMEISDKAISCPHCGYKNHPITETIQAQQPTRASTNTITIGEDVYNISEIAAVGFFYYTKAYKSFLRKIIIFVTIVLSVLVFVFKAGMFFMPILMICGAVYFAVMVSLKEGSIVATTGSIKTYSKTHDLLDQTQKMSVILSNLVNDCINIKLKEKRNYTYSYIINPAKIATFTSKFEGNTILEGIGCIGMLGFIVSLIAKWSVWFIFLLVAIGAGYLAEKLGLCVLKLTSVGGKEINLYLDKAKTKETVTMLITRMQKLR